MNEISVPVQLLVKILEEIIEKNIFSSNAELEPDLEKESRRYYPTQEVYNLAHGSYTVVTGRKGSGKTALCRFLQTETFKRWAELKSGDSESGKTRRVVPLLADESDVGRLSSKLKDWMTVAHEVRSRGLLLDRLWKLMIAAAAAKEVLECQRLDGVALDPGLTKFVAEVLTDGHGDPIEVDVRSRYSFGREQMVDNVFDEEIRSVFGVIENYSKGSNVQIWVLLDRLDELSDELLEPELPGRYSRLNSKQAGLIALLNLLQTNQFFSKDRVKSVRPIVFIRDDYLTKLQTVDQSVVEAVGVSIEDNTKLAKFRLHWTNADVQEMVHHRLNNLTTIQGKFLDKMHDARTRSPNQAPTMDTPYFLLQEDRKDPTRRTFKLRTADFLFREVNYANTMWQSVTRPGRRDNSWKELVEALQDDPFQAEAETLPRRILTALRVMAERQLGALQQRHGEMPFTGLLSEQWEVGMKAARTEALNDLRAELYPHLREKCEQVRSALMDRFNAQSKRTYQAPDSFLTKVIPGLQDQDLVELKNFGLLRRIFKELDSGEVQTLYRLRAAYRDDESVELADSNPETNQR